MMSVADERLLGIGVDGAPRGWVAVGCFGPGLDAGAEQRRSEPRFFATIEELAAWRASQPGAEKLAGRRGHPHRPARDRLLPAMRPRGPRPSRRATRLRLSTARALPAVRSRAHRRQGAEARTRLRARAGTRRRTQGRRGRRGEDRRRRGRQGPRAEPAGRRHLAEGRRGRRTASCAASTSCTTSSAMPSSASARGRTESATAWSTCATPTPPAGRRCALHRPAAERSASAAM